MNRCLVPDQHDGAAPTSQQMLQKVNDLVTGQIATIRLRTPSNLASAGCDQQRSNRINPLIVLNAGAHRGRLSPRRPRPLEGADQRLSIFVNKDKRCTQLTPLFLSWATRTVSSAQSLRRHAEKRVAVASGNSTSCVATDTTPRWSHTGHQTNPKSNGQCDQVSNSPQHSRGHTPPSAGPSPVLSIVAASNGRDDGKPCGSVSVCLADARLLVATVEDCAASRPPLSLLGLRHGLVVATQALASAVRPVERMFLWVSCPI